MSNNLCLKLFFVFVFISNTVFANQEKYQDLVTNILADSFHDTKLNLDNFRALLTGYEIDYQEPTYGSTILTVAVCENREDYVTLLLQHGANPNVGRFWGNTPLHYAAEYGFIKIGLLLLEANASLEAETKDKISPLAAALLHSQHDWLQEMLKTNLGRDYYVKHQADLFNMAEQYDKHCPDILLIKP